VAARFAVGIITARQLGLEGAGRLAYFLWMSETMATITGLGLQSTVTRFVADLHGQDRAASAARLARWLYGWCLALTVLGALGLGGAGLLSDNRAAWLCVGFAFPLQGMGAFYLAYLAGQQRFDRIARLNLISGLSLVAGVVAGMRLFGVPGALAGYAAGSAAPAILSIGLLRRPSKLIEFDRELAGRCLRYTLFAWGAAIVSAIVWSRTEVFFLERFRGPGAIAMFTVGIALSTLATQGPMLLSGALMPHFAQVLGAGDAASGRWIYTQATRLMALLLFPLCLGTAAITPVLLPAIYGEAFRGAVPGAMVLTAFAALAFSNVGSALVYGSGKAWFVAASGAVGASLSVAACMVVIPRWGAWGACLSRSGVQTLMVALGAWYLARHHGCPLPLAALGKILFAAAASAVCAYLTISLVGTVTALGAAIPLAAAVYVVLIRATRVLEPEDAAFLRGARDRVLGTVHLGTVEP
jgi:O-antigen/teichoic acid export membrane protein